MKPDILKTHAHSATDPSAVPETLRQIGNGVWAGRKTNLAGKLVHTVIVPVCVPIVRAESYRIEILGDGRELEVREGEAHSWVRNFYNFMSSQMCGFDAGDTTWGDGKINILDTGNNLRYYNNFPIGYQFVSHEGTPQYGYRAIKADDNAGIVIGTGSTAVDVENDYKLDTQIAHGNGGGEIQYGEELIPKPDAYDSGNHTLELARYFDNFSGGSITVNEFGIYSNLMVRVAYYGMVARDVIDGGVAVPDKAQARFAYSFSQSVPGSGSPLRNFYNQLITFAMGLDGSDAGGFGDGYLNITDVYGTLHTDTHPWGFAAAANIIIDSNGYRGRAGVLYPGIVIGTDDTGVTFNDNALGSVIPHGTAGGEMEYATGAAASGSWADPLHTVTHTREIANNSGVSIAVTEAGIVGEFDSTRQTLTCRNTFSDINVGDGETMQVEYQFQVTYP